eukprot:7253402-Prymnesium_polylepis.1
MASLLAAGAAAGASTRGAGRVTRCSPTTGAAALTRRRRGSKRARALALRRRTRSRAPSEMPRHSGVSKEYSAFSSASSVAWSSSARLPSRIWNG